MATIWNRKEGYRIMYMNSVKVVHGPSGRYYTGNALGLGCLTLNSPVRRAAIRLSESARFETLVMGIIFLNCVFLSVQGPPDSPRALFNDPMADKIELGFTIIFTAEMMVRTLAMGFACSPHSYLRDAWNKLDFLVVCMAWLPYLLPQLNNLSAIRSVRALRPLRTINRLPSMKMQVATLLNSLPKLRDVAMLTGFMLSLFGILGVQLFKGTLLFRCYDVDGVEPLDVDGGVCSDGDAPGSRGTCAEGQACRYFGENPVKGTVGFDNIALTWMTVFQCITLEGWVDVMYMVSRAVGPMSSLYCTLPELRTLVDGCVPC